MDAQTKRILDRRAAWRCELIDAAIACGADDPGFLVMMSHGFSTAFLEGLEAAANICDGVAAVDKHGGRRVATALALAMRDLIAEHSETL